MSPALKLVVRFCLEQAEKVPLKKRVSLYRGLAQICCSSAQSAKLCHMADRLETAGRECREFTFEINESVPGREGK